MALRSLKLLPIFLLFVFQPTLNSAAVTPPTISFNTPPSERIIAGAVLVSASASTGVVGVQFKLDGQNLGNEIMAPPFALTWNTSSSSNGAHTLSAVARDASGGQGTATEAITVDNTLTIPPPAVTLSI